jgi:phosphoribosylamine-glycine ligase
MRILIIGKGGREHALAWKLCQNEVNRVFVVPGNGGTAQMEPQVSNIDQVEMSDFPALVDLSKKLAIDLVIPGPDDVVVDGIADVFEQGTPFLSHQIRIVH